MAPAVERRAVPAFPGMRILLTGASGFLGHYLAKEIRSRGFPLATAGRSHCELALDLAEPESLGPCLRGARADLVIHAAAMASLAACEADPAGADAVNHRASRRLAEWARGRIVLVSTDLVFDGRAAPYRSDAPTAPLGAYARSKAAAEAAVRAAGGLVVRLPLLVGRGFGGRPSATDTIRSATAPLALFTNEHRTPLHAADAARGIVELALRRPGPGTLHVAGPERVSRFELGRRFLAASGLTGVRLEPAECTDPLRPRDVSLVPDWDCGRSLDAALAES
jgi:dTDP-4-dehydrorhamnose reductase